MKSLIHIQALYFFIFLRFFYVYCYESSSSCYHDSIAMPTVPQSHVKYVQREKRNTDQNYEPLKIHLHIVSDGLNQEIGEISNLILQKAIKDLSKIFSVHRVEGDSLLLKRNACASKWMIGMNIGRCSRLKANYIGEFCENKIDKFQIPSDFLEELSVYSFRSNASNITIKAGSGAKNANFILFITNAATNACLKNNIKAYSSYCQVDQYNRPIAGIINFCPQYMMWPRFEQNAFLKIVIHEILHVLGFSRNLFSKFNTCSPENSYCEARKNAVVRDTSYIPRFVFPNVVDQMQLHFNCSNSDFGGPLEQDIHGNYQSHWDPLLMYGSIMTPKLLDPEYVFIDPITLAYFADTGWYKVNFAYSQNYTWGRGEGCNFGSNETCEESMYLCDSSNNNSAVGCDFLHHTKSRCQAVAPYHLCGVFPPDKLNACYDPALSNLPSSAYQYDGTRCFVSKVKNQTSAECMSYKCLMGGRNYTVKRNNVVVTCPESKKNQMETTEIVCPRYTTFCSYKDYFKDTMYFYDDRDRQLCPFTADNFIIKLTMNIQMPSAKELMNKTDLSMMKADALKALSRSLNVSLDYMVNCTLTLFGKVILKVKICLNQENETNAKIKSVIKNIYKFNKKGMFNFIVDHGSPIPILISNIGNDKKEVLEFFDDEGYKILTHVPLLFVVFAVALCTAQVTRFMMMRRHRDMEKDAQKGRSFRESVAKMSLVFKNIY